MAMWERGVLVRYGGDTIQWLPLCDGRRSPQLVGTLADCLDRSLSQYPRL